jgi:hypothetical protein
MNNNLIVMSEAQLIGIIENTLRKVLNEDTSRETVQGRISGCRAAVDFLNKAGYRTSLSLMQKETAAGRVPCRKFHNKHLVFFCSELLEWAEKNCESVGDMSEVALAVATSANDKLRTGKKTANPSATPVNNQRKREG